MDCMLYIRERMTCNKNSTDGLLYMRELMTCNKDPTNGLYAVYEKTYDLQ